MTDDRRPHGPRTSSLRAALSAVLTPPVGLPVVPDDAHERTTCRCGHDHDEHRHWRPGSDCGRCGPGTCTAYRPAGGPVWRLPQGRGRRR